ncbi:MAG: MOSC domain-containing protein [Solirubrobacteraceae bacterium]|nr:MOSC domain-containing protein [Solirubrobacteraceae bacterium]
MARVRSLNVGVPKVIGQQRGAPVLSAIHKEPVDHRLPVRGVNIDGDDQADRTVHGGPDKAVYAYAAEDSAWWAEHLGREVGDGMFGENLTTEGIDCTGAVIGERWRFGSLLLEVCQPRLPCFKLGLHFGDPKMLKAFTQASRPGVYLRILEEGDIGAGDEVEVVDRPDHGVTIGVVSDAILKDITLGRAALRAPQLAENLIEWLEPRVARLG